MGLDAVELVMAVEDRFSISIPDPAASSMKTVGDLCDWVIASAASGSEGCIHQHVFYCVRDAMMAAWGTDRRGVRPTMRLEDLLPAQQRRLGWSQLARATGFRLPRLQRPAWVIGLAIFLPFLSVGVWFTGWRISVGAALAAGFLPSALLLAATASLATAFPNRLSIVGDLVRSISATNRVEEHRVDRALSQREIEQIVFQIASEQLQLPLEQVSRSSRWIDDLHL